MRKKAISVAACIGLLLTLVLAGPAGAHPITVGDLKRSDWFAKGPSAPNIGEVVRDTAGRGEFVWSDAHADQRVVDPNDTNTARQADLTRFNVTADTNNLYFLAKVDRYFAISNPHALQIMVSIDKDATDGASVPNPGQTALPDNVATNVAGAAAWEAVVSAKFAPGAAQSQAVSATPTVFLSNNTSSAAGAAQLVSSSSTTVQGGYAEIQVPWSAIGGMPAPQNALRFTVSLYYADHSAPSDGSASKAIDVLGNTASTTLAELGADSTIKTYVDLHFNAAGEVFAPLLISEFLPDPPTNSDPKGEWIEITNPNTFDVSLNGYKLGDQAYRGGSQGMVLLPNQPLLAGQSLVIANDKPTFQTRYPTVPSNKVVEMNSLAAYTSWASGKISLQNQNSGAPFKESLALLDGSDTLVDLVQYAYKTALGPIGLDPDNKPILLTSSSVAPNASYDRCPSTIDTNDSNNDFFVRDSSTPDRAPTPGVACTTVPGVDLRISKIGPDSIDATAGTPVQYIIPFTNAGATNLNSAVTITDTLPSGLTFGSQTNSVAGAQFAQNGQALTWTLPSGLASLASGTIVLTATLDNGVPQDTALTNSVGISSTPSEAPATLQNNVATQTVITAGPADLTVSTDGTWAAASGTSPGKEFSFTIEYSNVGEGDANDITITDTLPPNVTLVSSSVPTSNQATSGALTWRVSSLGYREGDTITVVAKIGAGVPTGAQLTNNVSISSSPADLNRVDEAPDSEQALLTVGNHLLYLPMIVK